MNNSLIYLSTPTSTSVVSGGTLPLNTIVRRRGCIIEQSNDSILLKAPGYYRVAITLTFTAPAAGTVTAQIKQDNNLITGAAASTTITTATTEVRSISFDTIVRVSCCNVPSVLTFVNSGVAITSSNIAVNVEYLN